MTFAGCGILLVVFFFFSYLQVLHSILIIKQIIIFAAFSTNFFGTIILIIYGIKLKKGKETDINMNNEILAISLLWSITLSCFYFLFIYSHYFSEIFIGTGNLFSIILVSIILLRNIGSFFISIILPIMKSKEEIMIPYGETRECISNVELTLSTVLPFKYFSAYIENYPVADAKNILALYTEIKLYESKAETEEYEEMSFDKATNIINDFIRPDGKLKVREIPEEVCELLNKKFENLRENLNKHLFDSVYGIVINSLQGMFSSFKKTGFFKQLCMELRENEIIYERLVRSQLI